MKQKILKRLLFVILFFIAVLICFPVFFLIVGSLMGADELNAYLGPVLGKEDGFAGWALLPTYPTFKAYVQLLLDSPEFFVMFWNSIRISGMILLLQLVTGVPAAWGFAKLKVPFLSRCIVPDKIHRNQSLPVQATEVRHSSFREHRRNRHCYRNRNHGKSRRHSCSLQNHKAHCAGA